MHTQQEQPTQTYTYTHTNKTGSHDSQPLRGFIFSGTAVNMRYVNKSNMMMHVTSHQQGPGFDSISKSVQFCMFSHTHTAFSRINRYRMTELMNENT